MQTLHMLSVVSRIIPTKGSSWPKSTTNKISSLRLRLIIFEVVCGINPIKPLLLVLHKWMEHGNTWKKGDLRRCSTKKNQNVYKKMYAWAYSWTWRHNAALLQTVASALPQSALAPRASRRGKNWKSECRPDMIRMIENQKFLMFFDPWRAKSSHRAGETQIFTLESHACQSKGMSMLQTFFDDSCKHQHFVS